MAKYTMLLNDYVRQGFSLPSFEEIDGFSDLFFATFCDREIGFETPQLFEIKLAARAKLVMPYYEEDVRANLGEQKSSITELPYDVQTAKPSTINKAEETINTNHREGNNREEGTTDINAILNALNHNVNMILKDLLKEFDSLFMVVY